MITWLLTNKLMRYMYRHISLSVLLFYWRSFGRSFTCSLVCTLARLLVRSLILTLYWDIYYTSILLIKSTGVKYIWITTYYCFLFVATTNLLLFNSFVAKYFNIVLYNILQQNSYFIIYTKKHYPNKTTICICFEAIDTTWPNHSTTSWQCWERLLSC